MVQQHLSTADEIMRELASRYRLKSLKYQVYHGGGLWPSRGLQKRIWFKISEFRIMLNAIYFQDQNIFYELTQHIRVECCNWGKTLAFHKVATYSIDQVKNADFLRKAIEELISKETRRRPE